MAKGCLNVLRPAPRLRSFLPAKRWRYAFLATQHRTYGLNYDQALRGLHLRRHKRATRKSLAGEQAGAGEEEGGEGEVRMDVVLFALICFEACNFDNG